MPALDAADRVRLAEAFHLADAVGDSIWPDWASAPFALILVTSEREFLLRHPRPSADFTRLGYDSLLATDVFVRPRVFSPTLLATFPAVGGVPTIVVGQPGATGRSSTAWVLTVLHEHFHQLQTSRPGYYAGVDALGLARGDQSGMWMLNYAFPYDSIAVVSRFASLAAVLDSTMLTPDFRSAAVPDALRQLRMLLTPDDYRYLGFQMWQEGVARYTELWVARRAATGYTPTAAFRALPDAQSYAAAANAIHADIRDELREQPLPRAQRVAFYAAGAATALLLDRANPHWRRRYFEGTFTLEDLFP